MIWVVIVFYSRICFFVDDVVLNTAIDNRTRTTTFAFHTLTVLEISTVAAIDSIFSVSNGETRCKNKSRKKYDYFFHFVVTSIAAPSGFVTRVMKHWSPEACIAASNAAKFSSSRHSSPSTHTIPRSFARIFAIATAMSI